MGSVPYHSPHEQYLALGTTPDIRQAAYRDLFKTDLDPQQVQQIREATNGGYALGDNRFKEEVAMMLNRRVDKGQAGRPRKLPKPAVEGARL